jgi:trigger factor
VKVENVKSRELPEVDADFAASQGNFESAEDLRTAIRERIEDRERGEYEQGYGENLLDRLVEGAEIKYPPQMLEDELDSMVHDLEHRVAQQNMDMETYLKTRQLDMQGLREELKPRAEERLKRALVMMELGRQEDVQVRSEEIQAGTLQTIERLYENMDPKQIRRQLNRDAIQNITASVTTDLIMRNTMNRLISIGKGEGDKVEEPAEAEALVETEPTDSSDAAGSADSDSRIEPELEGESVASENLESEEPGEPDEKPDEESNEQDDPTAKD